ncbi:excalibur calcium-binding domain-containing protein [Streptomyces mauvecolor]
MRISSPAVRTLLISGLLGALAFTTTGCQDDKPEKVKPPVASASAVTPPASTSPSPTPSASPSATPSSTPPAPTPPAPKLPPKPKPRTNGPSLPPPMNDGGGNGGGDSGGSSSGGGGGSVYYKNCAAVRAAGAAPLHRGDPGYAAHLDRDGDGIACEK